MTGLLPRTGEFTGRNVRWRWLAAGAVCGAVAMVVASALPIATIGAAAALLGIAVFACTGRSVGAVIASAGLGVLVPSTVPALLILVSAL
ncbi:hypothetical protein MX572_11790 [Rhodococcus pyridinivorans]|uniref:hypothetical protein n=1 Tax=Rhodococcus pyridinivorans TaxID=103816 RepID=UPI0020C5D791|nr:hypothetical protein [Rhodococcus pyridinivorans]UTM35288.1 hypothetical protein MX572_11790 [Rhodococcus pyridinivorans]